MSIVSAMFRNDSLPLMPLSDGLGSPWAVAAGDSRTTATVVAKAGARVENEGRRPSLAEVEMDFKTDPSQPIAGC